MAHWGTCERSNLNRKEGGLWKERQFSNDPVSFNSHSSLEHFKLKNKIFMLSKLGKTLFVDERVFSMVFAPEYRMRNSR